MIPALIATLDLGSGTARLPSELKQGRRRTSARLGAFAAAQPARKIVHEGSRWMLHGREVDITRGLASGTLDLQPREAAVDRIVGEGSIGSPSLHIRSFQLSQSNLSACWISAAPLARISADCAARMPVIARAFPNSFVRAFRSPPDSGVG
jgi:hypothetical protein